MIIVEKIKVFKCSKKSGIHQIPFEGVRLKINIDKNCYMVLNIRKEGGVLVTYKIPGIMESFNAEEV